MTDKPKKEEPRDVTTEIEMQLAWRGPNGGKQGHVVLTREQAEEALRRFDRP